MGLMAKPKLTSIRSTILDLIHCCSGRATAGYLIKSSGFSMREVDRTLQYLRCTGHIHFDFESRTWKLGKET